MSTTFTNSESQSPPPQPPQLLSIRPDLVSTAVNFLKDPQVKAAPLSKRLAFLESKGLTAEEIDLVLVKTSSTPANNPNDSNAILSNINIF